MVRILILDDDTCEFLNILSQQNITLPEIFITNLKWTRWTKQQIKQFLDEINKATQKSFGMGKNEISTEKR